MFSYLYYICAALVLYFCSLYIRVLYTYMRKVRLPVTNHLHKQDVKWYPQAPGPFPLPVIGNLNLLRHWPGPFQAFTELSLRYGNIYSLTFGSTRCLVINNLELIREVLNQNGKFFGGRPDFLRYHKLFGGNRNNSLALCDWSHLQQRRRNLARRHCSPRESTSYFNKMSTVACFEANEMIEKLREKIKPGYPTHIKQLIQQTSANMFLQYMCSMRFDYEDLEFQKIVKSFDEIFYEINQGYAVDFLPWLSPFYKKHFDKIRYWSTSIREFILQRIINEREQNLDFEEPEKDFTDALLKSLALEKNTSRDTIIFMLEDFVGGHSAVGNLVMLALAYIVKNPHVGSKIQVEADRVSLNGKRVINLNDMENMPNAMATILEVLRFSSSPIVPHVATEDAVISGYGITRGTIVFINNYNLNTNSKYWKNPENFIPERFLEELPENNADKSIKATVFVTRRNSESSDSGVEYDRDGNANNNLPLAKTVISNINRLNTPKRAQIKKNVPYFLPFSIGKRTCIGQNLVKSFAFILLSNILRKYNVNSCNASQIILTPATVALPTETFPLIFSERNIA